MPTPTMAGACWPPSHDAARRAAAPRAPGAAAAAPQLAFGAEIVAVRVWPAADYTRITIESDSALVARHTLFDAPDRAGDRHRRPRAQPAAARARRQGARRRPVHRRRACGPVPAARGAAGDRLEAGRAPQVFTLAPVAAYRHRLVFDLYPSEERDPLLALIRDKEPAEREAATAVRDALGEFIGRVEGGQIAKAPAASAPAPEQTTAARPRLGGDDAQGRPPDRRRARPRPWRRRSRCHRPERPARKGRGAGGGAAIARAHQCTARRARLPDPRSRLLRAAGRPGAEGPPRAGRPVRVDPRRRLHDARRRAAPACSR